MKRIGLLSYMNNVFLGYIIKAFFQADLNVAAVILDSKDATDKSIRIHEERTAGRMPLISLSELEEYKIPFFFFKNHNSEMCARFVKNYELDILVNASTPRILKADILNAPSIGVVNGHPGLLPHFRGCTCVEWAIYLNQQVGNTIHFMTEGIDEGSIIIQEGLTFKKSDSYVDVRVKVYQHGIKLLVKGVQQIIRDDLRPECLPEQGKGTYYSVIPDEKMAKVIDILNCGQYRYQL